MYTVYSISSIPDIPGNIPGTYPDTYIYIYIYIYKLEQVKSFKYLGVHKRKMLIAKTK